MVRESYDASVLGEFFWNSADLLSVLDSDGSWRIVNTAWTEHMGWSLEDLQNGPFIDLIHPDDVLATVREFDRLVAQPDATLIEFRLPPASTVTARYRWIEWTCQSREWRGLLRRSRHHESGRGVRSTWPAPWRRNAAILDAVVDSIVYTMDEAFRMLDVSPGTDRIYGVSLEERRGKNSLNIVLEDDRDHVAVELRRLFRGEDGALTNYHFRAQHVDGRMLTIETRGRLIRDGAGREPRAVLVSRDVTEAVAAEAVLKDARGGGRTAPGRRQERVHVAHEPRTAHAP